MLTVDQKLWFVPSESRDVAKARYVIVSKIGRKWAEVVQETHRYAEGRIDINTLWMDGGAYTPAGRCWLTKEDWELERQRQILWEDISSRINRWSAPDHLSIEQIRKIGDLLLRHGQSEDRK